jgi:hypothetical protein
MSQATKSAVADATNPNFVGDVKTHIFTINPGAFNKDYFFSADGSLVVSGRMRESHSTSSATSATRTR